MKATVERKEFLVLLDKLLLVVPARTVVPICTCVVLKAQKDRIVGVANNLEVAVSATCPATILATGEVCVEARTLANFVRGIKAKAMTLSTSKKAPGLQVEADNVSTSFDTQKVEDFPPVPEIPKGPILKVEGLAQALAKVEFAAATDNTRPVLNAVCLTPKKGGKVELVAADGFRLNITTAKASGKFQGHVIPALIRSASPSPNADGAFMPGQPEQIIPATSTANVIIPLAAIRPLRRLFPIGEVSMSYHTRGTSEYLNLFTEGITMVISCVVATFPNYQALIPKARSRLHVDSNALRNAITTINALKPANGIIRLQRGEGQLLVSANYSEGQECKIKIPVTKGTIKIAVNIKYLRDMLSVLKGEIVIETTSVSAPLKVTQQGLTQVIMPMFVQW